MRSVRLLMRQKYQAYQKYIIPVMAAILAIFPLIHVNEGVDITDTGYSLGNAAYFNSMQGVWVLATYLANVTGYIFTLLPGGGTMLGMSIYTALVISMTAVAAFFMLKKVFPLPAVFLGEILALSLCWCPAVILYNYMTYLFFTLAACLVYKGLADDKHIYLLLAGICLGANVMVRFPNVLQISMIIVVWYYAWLQKDSLKKVLQKTGWCAGGFVLGIAAVILIISIRYGFGEYVEMMKGLRQMSSEASSYSPKMMLLSMYYSYRTFLQPFIILMMTAAIGIAVYYFCRKKSLRRIFTGAYLAGIGGIIYWFWKQGRFAAVNYNDYDAMYFWALAFLVLSIIMAAAVILLKKFTHEQKALSLAVLIIIGITPLGSNNGLFPNYNNLFVVAPFTFWAFRELTGGRQPERRNGRNLLFPIRILTGVLLACILIQSLLFGLMFTFRDVGHGREMNTVIKSNDVLKGMKTSAENARQLEELTGYIYESGNRGSSVILYGEIPMISYAMEMPCAISSTWPDLPTFAYETMEADMQSVAAKVSISGQPVVIVDGSKYPEFSEMTTEDEKAKLIIQYMKAHEYEETFRNDQYIVYECTKPSGRQMGVSND